MYYCKSPKNWFLNNKYTIDNFQDLEKMRKIILSIGYKTFNINKANKIIKKNDSRKLKKICFDIDGVICTLSNDNIYSKSKPIKKNIKLINQLYKKNYEIILFTSRFMGRNKENSKKLIKWVMNLQKNN